jgi:type IV pilus assembly protein PilA
MKKFIKNYLAKLQENDKKGFSLVELIIVMAIMAILVGVVASQVIPYMEKSRQSKDQQQLSEICTAMVSAIAQSPVQVGSINSGTTLGALSNDTGAAGTNIADNVADLLSSGAGSGDLGDIQDAFVGKFKSSAYKNATAIYVSYNAGTTKVYVLSNSTTPADGSKLIATSD